MLSLLLLLSTVLDAHVHGVVRDRSTKQTLHGATVRVVGTTRGAITDRIGTFHLHDIVGDSITLDVSYVGYRQTRVRVGVSASEDVRIEVMLSEDSNVREEVVVTDARHQQSGLPTQRVDVLTAAEIDEHRGQTFSDVLTQVPGVTVVQTGPSISKPMIHGMMGTRIVLRNNGVIQEGQQWGAEHAPEIDPFTPSRISVVKGPASVMYGPNAMGGVIDVVPRPLPSMDGVHGEASANLFTNNKQGAAGVFVESRSIAGLPIGVRVQGAARRAGDALTPDYALTNTGFQEWSAGATLDAGDANLGLTATGTFFSTTLGIYKGAHLGNAEDLKRAIDRGYPLQTYPFTYDIKNPRQEIDHAMLSLQGRLRLSPDALLRLTYGWQQNDRSEFDAHNTRFITGGPDSSANLERALQTPAMNLLLTTYSADAVLEHGLTESIRGKAGVSIMRQVNDRSGSVFLVPDYTALGIGGFAYESLVLTEVTISAGLRYDVRWLDVSLKRRGSQIVTPQEKVFASVTASVGGLWVPSERWSLGINIATAWRPPQVNELYSNDVHHGTAVYEIGDSTLGAERTTGIDATVRYTIAGVELEASAYTNFFSNYILALPDPNNPTITVRGTFPTFRFTQLPAIVSGADLSATVAVSRRVNVYTTGSIVRGIDTESDQPLFLMPSDRLRIGTHVHADDVWFLHDAFVDLSVFGVRQQTEFVPGQDYAAPPSGYVRADVSLGGMIDIGEGVQSRLTISCQNILNTSYRDYLSRYRYFADDSGRNIIMRFTTTF